MTSHKKLLAASAVGLLLVAGSTRAMPIAALKADTVPSAVTQVEFHWFGDDDDHHKARRGGDDDNRYASNGHYEDDDDDDDEGGSSMIQQQNATPPSNGLFNPGSKPTVQSN